MPVTDQPVIHQAGDGEHVGARRARQGFLDRPILAVLIVGIALAVIGFVIAFASNNNSENAAERAQTRMEEQATAATFDAPAPAGRVVPSN